MRTRLYALIGAVSTVALFAMPLLGQPDPSPSPPPSPPLAPSAATARLSAAQDSVVLRALMADTARSPKAVSQLGLGSATSGSTLVDFARSQPFAAIAFGAAAAI